MSKPVPLQYETYYHIYNRGTNGETVFRQKRNYLYFLTLYLKYFYPFVETFAYCLMPNHFHFLVLVKSFEEIEELYQAVTPSQAFGNLCNAYAKAVNNSFGRTGSLFEHPFGRKPVTSDGYFMNLVVYIHRNPQKHGFVDDFRDWPYSSYDAILHDKPTRVDKTAVLDWFGSVNSFQEIHQEELDEKLIADLVADD